METPRITPAKTSRGVCPISSLRSFFNNSGSRSIFLTFRWLINLFNTFAWSPTAFLTPPASYVIIIEKINTIENRSDLKPCLRPIRVVKVATKEEWELGKPPEPIILVIE